VEIHKDLEKLTIINAVVTVGVFDGVHCGHDTIIRRLLARAREKKGESVVVTFWPHPRLFLTPEGAGLKFLSTLREKRELLDKKGVDHLIIVPFTRELSNYSSEKFIKEIIVGKVKTRYLIVGYNHHFGKNREGSFETLKSLADKYNIEVEQVDARVVDKQNVRSTLIREALNSGDILHANRLLGYQYSLNGTIIGGRKIGRSLGFPTANILPKERYKLIPRDGVYAVYINIGDQLVSGMLNIGLRPTLNYGENGKSIEVHIFDFKHQIYGKDVQVHFVDRIRDEVKFASVEQLVDQLKKDKLVATEILSRKPFEG
jgi:riboflavin kinase/FMN adenylyltransferase